MADDAAGNGTSGELESSADVRTAFIEGRTFPAKAVKYSVVDGLAIVEGDIILGTVDEVERRTEVLRAGEEAAQRGVIVTGAKFRWKGGVIPYQVDGNLANKARVSDAIRQWQERSPIRFALRTPANASAYPDYVNFQTGNGCSSWVGRQGNRQDINLGPNCSTGSTIHEIGHAVGLWHEQSREDRDKWVSIQYAHIEAGREHNFDQQITDGDDVGPYDYGSIMHYSALAFSKDGQPTIVPIQSIPPGVTMGQRSGLSLGDLAAVRFMYPVRTQSGFLVQSNFGSQGNFEMVIPALSGGLAHYYRNNDATPFTWRGPTAFGGSTAYTAVSMIQSNFGSPGNLEVLARAGDQLHYFSRDPQFRWNGPVAIASGLAGTPALIQGNFGRKGNFELVIPRVAGGLAFYWRNNDSPSLPWTAGVPLGESNRYQSVCMIQSNFGVPGNLEVVARTDDQLHFYWRDPDYRWNGPVRIASGVAGQPALVQSRFGTRGNFELVVPRTAGGLSFLYRNNDSGSLPWSGGQPFGGTARYGQVSLIQSNFGIPGNLEVVASAAGRIHHFYRDSGPEFRWHGPTEIA